MSIHETVADRVAEAREQRQDVRSPRRDPARDQHAVHTLQQVLRLIDIEPHLEIRELDGETFKQDPSASNRIWIAGKPMEEWLEGNVGSSRCCSVCGESECRTIEVSGTTFEAIPERLILKAALLAASDLVDTTADHVS